jgi:hypothetical protein
MNQLHKFDEFRIARKLIVFNRTVQSILLVTLLIGVNLFAIKFTFRWDITADRSNSLNAESVAYLREFEGELKIWVISNDELQLPNGRYAREDIKPLIEEYLHTADRLGLDGLEVEHVDIYKDREKVIRLRENYGFQEENLLLLVNAVGRRVVPVEELYQKNAESGEIEFRGEQAITAAILEISDPTRKKVVFTVGHGEMSLDDVDEQRGLSEFANYCSQRNIELSTIDLSRYASVPNDVDILVIASPQAGFEGEDVEKLRSYLERSNGSVMLFVEPFRQHNLDDMLNDWGILCDNAVIIDPGPDYQTASGNLIIRRFAEHPITNALFENKLYVYSNRPRPVRLDPAPPRIAGVERIALLGTSDTSWIENDFREESVPEFTLGRDLRGPIPVGVLAERRGAESLGLSLQGGRLIVFGDASLLSNNLFRLYGNRTLLANAINWSLQRNYLLSIPPEKIESYRLTISQSDLNTLLIALCLLPFGFGILGLLIRLIR